MVKGIGAKLNLKILTDFNFYFRGFEFHPDNESFNQTWILLFLYTQLYPISQMINQNQEISLVSF